MMDQDHDIEHDEEIDEEQEPQRNKRRPTKRKVSIKVKWKPQYDQHGQPDGDYFLDYSGQLGVITRTKVPVNIETWKKVDKNVKYQIWLEVKAYYKIPDDRAKKQALVQAGEMWKAFKTRLRSDYMDRGLSPCNFYKYVEPHIWESFTRQEDTPIKKARRDQGKFNASKKKFPPRLGPSGYHGKEKIWAKERANKDIATPTHFFEHSVRNFTLARMPQDETRKRHVPPDMADVVNELASYNERMTDGTWVPPPRRRCTNSSIKKKEHRGRTVGVGTHVGFTKGIPGYTPRPRIN